MGFDLGEHLNEQVDQVQSESSPGGLGFFHGSTRDCRDYPSVVKSPIGFNKNDFHSYKRVRDEGIVFKHIIVTVRSFDAVCKSAVGREVKEIRCERWKRRRRIQIYGGRMMNLVGRIWNFVLSRHEPFTVIEFPRMVRDREYLFSRLSEISGVTRPLFDTAFDKLANEDKVHFE
jgi:hypothetical protein